MINAKYILKNITISNQNVNDFFNVLDNVEAINTTINEAIIHPYFPKTKIMNKNAHNAHNDANAV